MERAKAEANLATEKAKLNRDVDIARIQAQRATESQDEDLKKQVEMKRAAAELERLRATDGVKASIEREATQQAADARAYETQAEARAEYERATREADAAAYHTRQKAEAEAHANGVGADAELAATLKQAEGLSAMADAYARMGRAFGGPQGLLQYLMIEKGTYVELARANADAIRGLEPKISVWNTGSAGDGAAGSQDPTAAVRNVYQMLPPLMSTINDQTGITLPEWQFGRMPEALANKENRDHESRQKNGL